MFKLSKETGFPTVIFVSASIATLIVVGLIMFFIRDGLVKTAQAPTKDDSQLKFDDFQNDPLLTRIPNLKNILNGPLVSESDPLIGPADAPIVIVEFSDFTCSFCRSQEKVIKRIMAEYPDKIKLIWKDYPEASRDSRSYQAAVAARCAEAQGAFWSYHDLLFNQETVLNKQTFLKLADSLKLNNKKFAGCLEEQRTKEIIEDNITEANALAINGVPFMFINSQEVMGESSFADFKNIIELELNKNDKQR